MALMTSQAVSSVITPTFSAVNASDTITPEPGLLLYVKVGATPCTITVVVPGNQYYSGSATTDLVPAGSPITSTERCFYLPRDIQDPTTNLITVTYSPTTAVTSALIKVG